MSETTDLQAELERRRAEVEEARAQADQHWFMARDLQAEVKRLREKIVRLENWQHIASPYIGMARLHLENGEPDRAKADLDTCCDKLDALMPEAVRKVLERQNARS